MKKKVKSLEIKAMSDLMAKRLKELRTEYKYTGADGKQHHLSHAALSQRLTERGVSVSESSLKNYEAPAEHDSKALSNTGMDVETLYSLAKLYNVSADYILGISDTPSFAADHKIASKVTGLTGRAVNRVRWLMNDKQISGVFDTILARRELTDLLRAIVECRRQVHEIDKTYLELPKNTDNEAAWRDCRRRLWHTKRDFSDAIEQIFAVITGTSVAEKKIEDALDAIAEERALMENMEDRDLYMEEADNAEEK